MTTNTRLRDRIAKLELPADGGDGPLLLKVAFVGTDGVQNTGGIVRIEGVGHHWDRLDGETEDQFTDRATTEAATYRLGYRAVCVGFPTLNGAQ